MRRLYGDSSGTTPTESLSYTYTGPKRNTWTYDAHGNVTADPQAGLGIEWNAIGLPRTITASSGTDTASTQRFYLADGSLAQVSDGTTTRLYLGDMVFEKAADGTVTLESAGWEGGRLLPGTGADKILYVVKDHLGSVRVVKDGTGSIRQRFDYYPYGTVSRAWTSSATTDDSEKRYRFGGKEVAGSALTDLAGEGSAPGAPYLDFGARLYSPRKAMWLSPDPLMEKYYGIGPNVYCAGNPVNLKDPNGRAIWIFYGDNKNPFFYNGTQEESSIPNDPFVKAVIEAYKYNKENWIREGYTETCPSTDLIEKPAKEVCVSVIMDSRSRDQYFRDNGGTQVIIWNPTEGLETDTGAILSPATSFCHEADHALDDVDKDKKHEAHEKRRGMSTHRGFINDEEYRVVNGSEQKMAVANGEIPKGRKTRNSYTEDSDKIIYTKGVTSNKKRE